jgi:hypothetical protein
VRVGAGHWMVGGRRAARSGAVVLATPPACRLKSPHALRVPAYRLALRVGSVPTPRVIMQAVFPWRQGTPCGDMIASVTFSQPERLRPEDLHIAVVELMGTVIPEGAKVVLLGDGEFDGTALQARLSQMGWSSVCRTALSTTATWEGETFRLDV